MPPNGSSSTTRSDTPLTGQMNVYEVERIVDHRETTKGRQYLLKWAGYPESDNTWEAESDLHCSVLLRAYWNEKNHQRSEKLAAIVRSSPLSSPIGYKGANPQCSATMMKQILGLEPTRRSSLSPQRLLATSAAPAKKKILWLQTCDCPTDRRKEEKVESEKDEVSGDEIRRIIDMFESSES
jgi:hypothetical protein